MKKLKSGREQSRIVKTNKKRTLPRSLNGTQKIKYAIIVWDNGSGDGWSSSSNLKEARSVAKSIVRQIAKETTRIGTYEYSSRAYVEISDIINQVTIEKYRVSNYR